MRGLGRNSLCLLDKKKMTNLNKKYHKGKYRAGEWAKHLRPFLKRLGNKRFRKVAATIDDDEFEKFEKSKKKKGRKRIKAKITVKTFGDSKYSYYKSYRTMKDLEKAIQRPNVISYSILSKPDNEKDDLKFKGKNEN